MSEHRCRRKQLPQGSRQPASSRPTGSQGKRGRRAQVTRRSSRALLRVPASVMGHDTRKSVICTTGTTWPSPLRKYDASDLRSIYPSIYVCSPEPLIALHTSSYLVHLLHLFCSCRLINGPSAIALPARVNCNDPSAVALPGTSGSANCSICRPSPSVVRGRQTEHTHRKTVT